MMVSDNNSRLQTSAVKLSIGSTTCCTITEKALVGAFSVIVKTDCETDGSFYSTNPDTCNHCDDGCYTHLDPVKHGAGVEVAAVWSQSPHLLQHLGTAIPGAKERGQLHSRSLLCLMSASY